MVSDSNQNQDKGAHLGNQRGAVLLALIVSMTILGALGGAMLELTTTSTQAQITAYNHERAYYLAEAGFRYAASLLKAEPAATPSGTFTLGDGEKFSVVSFQDPNDSTRICIQSTGIVSENSSIEVRRRITYSVVKSEPLGGGGGDGTLDLRFDSDNDGQLDDVWNVQGWATMQSTGPSGNEPALHVKGTDVALGLDWEQGPDLARAWEDAGGLLDYGLQVKIKVRPEGSNGNHYLLGLSFRLDLDLESGYGVSFFKSIGSGTAPAWVQPFQSLRGQGVCVVFWKKVYGEVTLLDFQKLEGAGGIGAVVEDGDVKPWSTLVVKIEEDFSEFGGGRQNHVRVFVQEAAVYPRGGAIQWDEDAVPFVPVNWHIVGQQALVDDTFTTEGFPDTERSEVGIHAHYDGNPNNQEFFDDFGMRLDTAGSGGTGLVQF